MKATATLALVCSTALIFAATSAQARPTHNAALRAAATAALSTCKIVITATPGAFARPAATLPVTDTHSRPKASPVP
ncbi:MAG TPA: hypothetical protein VGO31_15390 [Microbacteriaceae bacterium]|nr:hypothetical protein [Microbacteriaceae bacterium]